MAPASHFPGSFTQKPKKVDPCSHTESRPSGLNSLPSNEACCLLLAGGYSNSTWVENAVSAESLLHVPPGPINRRLCFVIGPVDQQHDEGLGLVGGGGVARRRLI